MRDQGIPASHVQYSEHIGSAKRTISLKPHISPIGEIWLNTEIGYCHISLNVVVSPCDENGKKTERSGFNTTIRGGDARIAGAHTVFETGFTQAERTDFAPFARPR